MTAPVYQWQPTTAEIARRAGIPPDEVIRFDHNTSPYGPPWAAAEASAAATAINEYPGADYRPLKEAVAAYRGVEPAMVVPGAGADELIGLCAKAFLDPGSTALSAPPTYTLYAIATAHHHARLLTRPRSAPDFGLPEPGDERARADLVWLCLPNNPTGAGDDFAMVQRWLSGPGVVVVDAAYSEFAGDDWAARLDAHPSLVVLGTLSKAFGLAAIRVGYALAAPGLAARLEAVRPPGSISTISAALAARALADPAIARSNVAAITAERDRLAQGLRNLGLAPQPSITNFLLTWVGPAAPRVEAELMDRGLVVRRFAGDGPLAEYLRFTVRTPAEDDRLLKELERSMQ